MSLLIPHCDILLHTNAHTCLLFLEVNFIFQIVSKSMVFLDFKEPIKTCDSDNCKIKDSFSCLIFLSSLLDFLKQFTYQKGIFREIIKIVFKDSKRFMLEEVMDHT
jgi:hypothetical protein